MARQLSSMEMIKGLTGLVCTMDETLESPTAPWLWELTIHGPAEGDSLLPWAEKFREQWSTFASGKQFFTELDLLTTVVDFIRERYFDRNGR